MVILRAVGVVTGLVTSIGVYYQFVAQPFLEAHTRQMAKSLELEETLLSKVTFSSGHDLRKH